MATIQCTGGGLMVASLFFDHADTGKIAGNDHFGDLHYFGLGAYGIHDLYFVATPPQLVGIAIVLDRQLISTGLELIDLSFPNECP